MKRRPKIKLPYLDARKDRNGQIRYWYFRRNKQFWKLPGETFADFADEYKRLVEYTDGLANSTADIPAIDKRSYSPDRSASWCRISRQRRLRRLKETDGGRIQARAGVLQLAHGDKRVANLRRRHIRKMRDTRTATPGAANTIVRMLKIVLNFAVEEEWIENQSAAGMKLLKVGEWRAWTDAECKQFEKCWPQGSMQRRAYALAVYTGQRCPIWSRWCGCIARMGLSASSRARPARSCGYRSTRHSPLSLVRGDIGHLSLLTTTQGKAFDPVYFGAWFCRRDR
jgi:hypothetical protein